MTDSISQKNRTFFAPAISHTLLYQAEVRKGASRSISLAFAPRMACQRSQSNCNPSQKSADIPKTRAKRSAVSDVIARLPHLDEPLSYGVQYPMPQARLVLHTKYIDELGGIVEMKAYQVPKTMSTPHGYKYSLVYIRDGQRVVGYDNHEQKGDHRHNRDLTLPYAFRSVDRLIDDFLSAVATIKKEMPR